MHLEFDQSSPKAHNTDTGVHVCVHLKLLTLIQGCSFVVVFIVTILQITLCDDV